MRMKRWFALALWLAWINPVVAQAADVAASRTAHLGATGGSPVAALTGGYHTAFLVGGAFAVVAAAIGAAFIRTRATVAPGE